MIKHQHQDGIGLVEVIVSLLLLAVATLGFIAMQGSAIKLTSESEERTRSLALMREIGEKVRVNPSAIETYVTKINTPDTTAPTKDCGLYSASSATPPATGAKDTVNCSAQELATVQSYYMTQKIAESEFKMGIVACPSGANKSNSVMHSYCLISAWGDTKPTVGTDADDSDGEMDCLTQTGAYHPKATCMQIGLD